MKIQIEQSPTGTGEFRWALETGPEHIDVYSGTADTLGECFQEIIRMDTLNALDYREATEKDNPNLEKIIDKMVEERKAQKLWNILIRYGYADDVDEILDLVEKWLPEPQSAASSQNVNTELLVEGFNDCVRKMKEMLR